MNSINSNPCIICGSSDSSALYGNADIEYVMCDKCTLISLSPMPTEKEYEAFYKNEYQRHRHEITTYEQAVTIREQKGLKGKKTYVDELTPFLREGMSVFEIGCGWGSFLKLLRDTANVDVEGIEPSELTSKVAREHYNLTVKTESLGEYMRVGDSRKFDAVVMMHTLEHFVDPGKALKDAKSLLKSGGVMLIAVPNTAKPNEPLNRFFHFEHCYYFTPLTLRELLKKHGLKIIKIVSTNNEIRAYITHDEDERVEADASYFDYSYTGSAVRSVLKKQDRKYKVLRALKTVAKRVLPRSLFSSMRRRIVAILKKLHIIEI